MPQGFLFHGPTVGLFLRIGAAIADPVLRRVLLGHLAGAGFALPAKVDDLAHRVILPWLEEQGEMGETIEIKAADGHVLSAYAAGLKGAPHGLVVVQEIFGVNRHMRDVCDMFADKGFRVVAPALFDRVQRGVELGYAPDDVKQGRTLRGQVPDAGTVADIEAAAEALGNPRPGIIGYCWGGTVAWWGATRSSRFTAAVGWYGGGIAATRDELPLCPVQLHFGETDASIPLSDVEAIRIAQPEAEVFVYPGAGHGFGCDERPTWNPDANALALERSLAFFGKVL